jgi:hypothetical protein
MYRYVSNFKYFSLSWNIMQKTNKYLKTLVECTVPQFGIMYDLCWNL